MMPFQKRVAADIEKYHSSAGTDSSSSSVLNMPVIVEGVILKQLQTALKKNSENNSQDEIGDDAQLYAIYEQSCQVLNEKSRLKEIMLATLEDIRDEKIILSNAGDERKSKIVASKPTLKSEKEINMVSKNKKFQDFIKSNSDNVFVCEFGWSFYRLYNNAKKMLAQDAVGEDDIKNFILSILGDVSTVRQETTFIKTICEDTQKYLKNCKNIAAKTIVTLAIDESGLVELLEIISPKLENEFSCMLDQYKKESQESIRVFAKYLAVVVVVYWNKRGAVQDFSVDFIAQEILYGVTAVFRDDSNLLKNSLKKISIKSQIKDAILYYKGSEEQQGAFYAKKSLLFKNKKYLKSGYLVVHDQREIVGCSQLTAEDIQAYIVAQLARESLKVVIERFANELFKPRIDPKRIDIIGKKELKKWLYKHLNKFSFVLFCLEHFANFGALKINITKELAQLIYSCKDKVEPFFKIRKVFVAETMLLSCKSDEEIQRIFTQCVSLASNLPVEKTTSSSSLKDHKSQQEEIPSPNKQDSPTKLRRNSSSSVPHVGVGFFESPRSPRSPKRSKSASEVVAGSKFLAEKRQMTDHGSQMDNIFQCP